MQKLVEAAINLDDAMIDATHAMTAFRMAMMKANALFGGRLFEELRREPDDEE